MSSNPPRKPPSGSAYEKALGLLARREHSARELRGKLSRRGFDADESAATLERLRGKDFQNDGRFGEMLVRSRIAAGYGPRWILAELKTHGITEAQARGLIDAADPDWVEVVRGQLRRRYGRPAASPAERTKRANFLLRRGFDVSTVKLALGSSPDEPADGAD